MAAQAGAAAEAEEVIEDMRTAGLAPGPRAYHGLIFSHAKVSCSCRRSASGDIAASADKEVDEPGTSCTESP